MRNEQQRAFRFVPPRASAMIEALRGLGYTAGAAVADIVDNCIAARARHVEVVAGGSGDDLFLAILDDGRGMTDPELESAMRLGDRNPLDERDPDDLGRFGLGLKTASFSQARRLTVASRKAGKVSVLRWDLDELAGGSGDGWNLLEGFHPGSESRLELLDSVATGTLVLLERPDRMVQSTADPQEVLDVLDRIERHLGMVFHRFIADGSLRLSINGKKVAAWDPFLASHPATWSSPVLTEGRAPNMISAQAFVLPHRDHLKPVDHQAAGGPDGWSSHQGLFVYRNRRLLVPGGWLGLGRGRRWTNEEPYRLARIRLDLPNSLDTDWKIDVRKATAQVPTILRKRLTHLAEDARERARKVFAYRGSPAPREGRDPTVQAWQAVKGRNGTRYRVDRTHPAVATLLEEFVGAPQLRARVEAMLRVIEETVPVQRIWLDTAEDRDTPRTGFQGEPPAEVRGVAEVLFRSMTERKGMSPDLARASLLRTEPFDQYPDLVATLGGI